MRYRATRARIEARTLLAGNDPVSRFTMSDDSSSVFRSALASVGGGYQPAPERWLFIPYDQLSDQLGPLSRHPPGEIGVVLIESAAKASRRPYHRRKLALVLTNMRHFAVEQAQRGVQVRYVMTRAPYADALREVVDDVGPLSMMEPAERELRQELTPLVVEGSLRWLPHEGWLTTAEDFAACQAKHGGPPYRMDAFYRAVRRRLGLLMTAAGKPVGGRFSFDGENRRPWPGTPAEPPLPAFEDTAIKREVCSLVNERFAHHPGTVDPETLPTTRSDAETLWAWAKRACLPLFGPYEDAMAAEASRLFHTKISELLNIHRLLPRQVVADAVALELPFASKEGFVRQVIGWREFVRHVHRATDGFREGLPGPASATASAPVPTAPGDGGFSRWSGEPWRRQRGSGGDGGATPNALAMTGSLPPAYWGAPSGLHCLDSVISQVWREGYSHHITRLMVLSNLASLLDVSPRELTDWFWAAYSDAYDWVVEPNVLGMGTFAAGPVMTTKPYVSGAAYIDRMSDYCRTCAFHPKKSCPVTPLYWHFLRRKEPQLRDNQRLSLPLASMRRRGPERASREERIFDHVTTQLQQGKTLRPSDEAFSP